MLKKTLIITALLIAVGVCLTGCKDGSTGSDSDAPEVKTAQEYQAEAEKEITADNMAEELDTLERELENDLSQEP